MFRCPLCASQAAHEGWLTEEQEVYVQQVAEFHMHDAINAELDKEFRGSENIEFKPERNTPPAPTTLHERNDMIIVEPPCHPWEPVKVPQERADSGALYCLVCGEGFSA